MNSLVRLFLCACAFLFANSVLAISFGEPDNNEHPHVGTLLYVQNGVGFYSCTGTLLSPTVMLTAGHCVEESGNVNDVTYVRFDEDALEGIDEFATLSDWFADRWIEATQVIPHPDYDDYSAFPETFDVGLVILSEPVFVSTYGVLPDEGMLEAIKAQKGNKDNWFINVGYGSFGVNLPFVGDTSAYGRYKSITRLIELNGANNGSDSSAKFSNNPGAGRGGTCFGDSGGPVFYQDTPIITAVVSFGYTPCIGNDYQFRIDTPTALDFILPYLAP